MGGNWERASFPCVFLRNPLIQTQKQQNGNQNEIKQHGRVYYTLLQKQKTIKLENNNERQYWRCGFLLDSIYMRVSMEYSMSMMFLLQWSGWKLRNMTVRTFGQNLGGDNGSRSDWRLSGRVADGRWQKFITDDSSKCTIF